MCKLEIGANDKWVQFCMFILAVSGFGGLMPKWVVPLGLGLGTQDDAKVFWIFLGMVVWMHLKFLAFGLIIYVKCF